MDLEALRKEIDAVDNQIIELFAKRMDVAANIAQYKKEVGKAVFDPAREQEKLEVIAAMSRGDIKDHTVTLFKKIFELSRLYQTALLENNAEVIE